MTPPDRQIATDAPLHDAADTLRPIAPDDATDLRYLRATVGKRLFGDRLKWTLADRYTVRHRLGDGGGGNVFASYDQRLKREVAIKIIRARSGEPAAAVHRRLAAEAKALAHLSHPNVVAVYDVVARDDVGADDEALYLVMELVAGQDVNRWGKSAVRSWRDVVDVYVRAGRGIVAAHNGGIIHRDIKPSNILVGAQGLVKVADFGLACPVCVPPPNASGCDLEAPTHSSQTTLVQPRHRVAGTVPYMAPELCRGGDHTRATDKYAFFVALFETLTGSLPFTGLNLSESLAAKRRGALEFPPLPALPRALRALLVRELCADPQDRPRNMRRSLWRLERVLHPSRRWWWAAPLAVGAGLGLAWVPQPAVECSASATLDEVWGDAQRRRVSTALAGAKDVNVDGVVAALNEFASQWNVERTRTCALPRRVRGGEAKCLNEALIQFEGLVSVLSEQNTSGLVHADNALRQLSSPHRCVGAELGEQQIFVAAETSRYREEALRELARAKALRDARDLGAAMEEATAVLRRIKRDGSWDTELRARALTLVGDIKMAGGDHDGGIDDLETAYFLAWGAGLGTIAWEAALFRARSAKHRPGDPDGMDWLRQAESASSLAASPRLARAQTLNVRGQVLSALGNDVEALAAYREAGRLCGDCPGRGLALANVGAMLVRAGKYPEALRSFGEAHALLVTRFGEGHPIVAQVSVHTAATLDESGDSEAAVSEAKRVIALLSPPISGSRSTLAFAWHVLSRALLHTSRARQAVVAAEAALATLGPMRDGVVANHAVFLQTKAVMLLAAGEWEQACEDARQALEVAEQVAADTILHRTSQRVLGDALLKTDQFVAAAAMFEAAAAPMVDGLEVDAYDLALATLGRGQAVQRTQGCAAALPILTEAHELALGAGALVDEQTLGQAMFAVGYCEGRTGGIAAARRHLEGAWDLLRSQPDAQVRRSDAAWALGALWWRDDRVRAHWFANEARAGYRALERADRLAALKTWRRSPGELPELET